jgi:site-specific recombinase XerD
MTEWLQNWRAHVRKTDLELVFPSNTGAPISSDNLRRRVFKSALKKSGITREVTAAGHPPFRWHDLRHVYASILLGVGASIYDVQKALGHRSVTTTEQLYAHLTQGHFADLRERLSTVTAQVELEVPRALRAVR